MSNVILTAELDITEINVDELVIIADIVNLERLNFKRNMNVDTLVLTGTKDSIEQFADKLKIDREYLMYV